MEQGYLGSVNVEVIGLGKGDTREESDSDEKLGLHLCGEYLGYESNELCRCVVWWEAAKERHQLMTQET